MNKISRRDFLKVATACGAAVALTACGSSSSSTAASVGSASAGSSVGEPVTVTFWTCNAHDKDFMQEQTDAFNSTIGKDMNVTVDFQYKDDMDNMLSAAFTSDQAPDLFIGGTMPRPAAESGWIVSLEDLPGGTDYLKKYDGYMSEGAHLVDGKAYTVPYSATTYGLVYNKDMFVAAGIVDENGEAKPPETWAEYLEDAEKLTNADKNEFGVCYPAKWGGFLSFDVLYASEPSDGCPYGWNPKTGVFDITGWGEMMKIVMNVKRNGWCVPGADGLDNDPARARFSEGGIGMKSAASFDYAVYTTQFPAQINWGVAPFPYLDLEKKYRGLCDRGSYLMINAAAVDKVGGDRLMEIYKYYTSDEILSESFKGGYNIPYNYDIVRDVELSDDMNQWKQFAQLCDTGLKGGYKGSPATDMTGLEDWGADWNEKIWPNENITDAEIETYMKNGTDALNAGMQAYVDAHPDYDLAYYTDPDFDNVL